jgi:hypothetical protein
VVNLFQTAETETGIHTQTESCPFRVELCSTEEDARKKNPFVFQRIPLCIIVTGLRDG